MTVSFRTFESAVLTRLVDWASASFESTIGQPALPHLIIALNATELTIDQSQWDVSNATSKLFSDMKRSFERIPALQDHVERWRECGRVISTTEDLLNCYYSSTTIVRIPVKGRYMLMDEQIKKLDAEISIKSYQSQSTKRRVRMLSSSDDLQLYLQFAFDHFSNNLNVPFDFVKTALQINPIPPDFGGNIVALAVAIKNRYERMKVFKIFEHLSLLVASCIWLDILRYRRLGQYSIVLSWLLDDKSFRLKTPMKRTDISIIFALIANQCKSRHNPRPFLELLRGLLRAGLQRILRPALAMLIWPGPHSLCKCYVRSRKRTPGSHRAFIILWILCSFLQFQKGFR